MNNENLVFIESETTTPQIFYKNIKFNDGTQITLEHNSIVIFTGSNNSGKSQVLKDAENYVNASNSLNTVIIKEAECEFCGRIDEPVFLNSRFSINSYGNYHFVGEAISFDITSLRNQWQSNRLRNGLHTLFIKRLSTEMRLTVSNDLKRSVNSSKHPIFKLYEDDDIAQTISNYFYQAFGKDLVVNRNEMNLIPLHVGQAPDKKSFTMAQHNEYYNKIKALPKLVEQGDGMRSFASILLDTFTSDYNITLIDEPEAFLHPPQARVLGKMLAKNNSENRQIFIATHSEDFLQGLLDADNDNVTVIRIDRIDNLNRMSILKNDEIKKLWSNPILRYSNILSGLFHEKVVVCESDYDCLFYQALINAMYESKHEVAPDILFTHCGGKTRAKDVVSALKAVNVPVASICDFDLLNDSSTFKALVISFGFDWQTELSDSMKVIYDNINAKNSTGNNVWAQIKRTGKSGFDGDAPAAYDKVEAACKKAGLFVVPVGEMECFDKTINKEKKDWVYHVLETYDLATEPKLEYARKFVQEIVDYKVS